MGKKKETKVIGGIGEIWGKQFHQHGRVYEKKTGVTISASRKISWFIYT